ncbi:MAG TPA: hypothetical protein VGF33_10750 [Caulobacteraceae bacterium]
MKLKLLRLATPVCGLALLALAAGLYILNYPLYLRALTTPGAYPLASPFLDWDNVASAIQCWRRGVDVYVNNPCDVLGRPFAYSPLWLRATFIPAGVTWRYVVGLGLDILFISSQYFVFRPANWREAGTFAAAGVSTMAVFAAERANVDLIIYIMLVSSGTLSAKGLGRRLSAYGAILLAGFLKFYPFVGLVLALRERPRALFAILAISALAIVAFGYGYRHELAEMGRNIPQGRFGADDFGAANLLYLFPVILSSSGLWLAAFAVLTVLAGAVALSISLNAGFARAFASLDGRDRTLLTLGAAVIAGCYFSGQNISYRGIFLILVVGGLLAMRRGADDAAVRTRLGWLTVIIIALMWDGIYRSVLFSLNPALWGPLWLIREALWWYLAAALLAVLITFATQSESFVPARRWFERWRPRPG